MYRATSVRSRSYSPPPRSRSRARSIRDPDPRTPSPPSRPSPRAPPQASARSPRDRAVRSSRRGRGYNYPNNDDQSPPRRKKEVTLILCVYHSTSHNWKTHPVTFRPDRINDRELWEDIRYTFRTDVQKPWRRFFGFKKVKNVVPIAYSPNMVPIRTDPKDFPQSRQLVHAYRHPERLRPEHNWVDFFCNFDASDKRQNGLEFIEGVWADKLAAVAVAASIAIVVVSVVWCVKGGQLQTVFTVMGFVLAFVTAEIALVALYYQLVSNDAGSSGGSS